MPVTHECPADEQGVGGLVRDAQLEVQHMPVVEPGRIAGSELTKFDESSAEEPGQE